MLVSRSLRAVRDAHLGQASLAQVCSLLQLLEISPGKIPMQTSASRAPPLQPEGGRVWNASREWVLHGKCCGLLPIQLESIV